MTVGWHKAAPPGGLDSADGVRPENLLSHLLRSAIVLDINALQPTPRLKYSSVHKKLSPSQIVLHSEFRWPLDPKQWTGLWVFSSSNYGRERAVRRVV